MCSIIHKQSKCKGLALLEDNASSTVMSCQRADKKKVSSAREDMSVTKAQMSKIAFCGSETVSFIVTLLT